MARIFQEAFKVLDAKAANGIGSAMLVDDFRNIEATLTTSGSAAGVINFQISNQETKPDFTAAASPTNIWTYAQAVDLADQSTVAGATGITLSGTDTTRTLEININAARWFCVILSSWTVGAFTILAKPYNDVA